MDKNKIFLTVIGVLAIVAFLVGAYFATNQPKEIVVVPEIAEIKPDDHTKWSNDNKIVLVEYSDLQCPACAGFHSQLEAWDSDKELTDNVTFVYRHFPLKGIHKHAEAAAWAAEAAGKQGKFFEMVDLMFTGQADWRELDDPTEVFTGYAQQLELDAEQFATDMKSDEVKQKVEANYLSGITGKVDATPSFFLNGQKMEFASYEQFRQQLKEAIDAAKAGK